MCAVVLNTVTAASQHEEWDHAYIPQVFMVVRGLGHPVPLPVTVDEVGM